MKQEPVPVETSNNDAKVSDAVFPEQRRMNRAALIKKEQEVDPE